MKIPLDLQHFPHPTLIVASDTVSAHCWLVAGDSIEILDGVALPHEHLVDRHESGPNTGNEDEERLHRYQHALCAHIVTLSEQHPIAHLHLIMPTEMDRAVSAHLPQKMHSIIGKHVHIDAMNESPIDIIRRIIEA